jgi:hypothetical protein
MTMSRRDVLASGKTAAMMAVAGLGPAAGTLPRGRRSQTDCRRICRELKTLVAERVEHGLLGTRALCVQFSVPHGVAH